LTTLSRYQQQTGNQPRVIHAPALHGHASLIAREPALAQRQDSVMQPGNFQQHGSDDRESSYNRGSNASRSVYVGGRHDGYQYDGYSRYDHGYSYSSGYGYGYSHYTSRRYHARPVVVIQYGDPWFNCRPVSPVVIYRPRPYCPPPVVVCPMPRPSGFSFHVRF
ncbi:MAG: hypothetical protein HC898_01400, partial [Phycisphaerales bacterium]|nr:hypothetical protein [Phycisphaerales bacterium]